jgi:uncharacterized protein (TIGR02246 family)
MRYSKQVIPVILVLILFGLSVGAQNKFAVKDIETIRNIEEVFRTAWLKNDEKTILSLFTDDAVLFPGGNPPVRGKDGLYKYWFAPSETVTTITAFDVEIEDVSGSKDYATVTAADKISWTTQRKDKTGLRRFVSRGHFLAIYVKEGRDWKIWRRFAASKTEEVK